MQNMNKKYYYPLVIVAVAVAVFVGWTATRAAPISITKTLSGDEQVPPVNTSTTGSIVFSINDERTAAPFSIDVASGTKITSAHLHCALRGANGPIVAQLFGDVASGTDVSGNLVSSTLLAADINASAT